MNAKEFVEVFYMEKENILKLYFSNLKETEVGLKINSLALTHRANGENVRYY